MNRGLKAVSVRRDDALSRIKWDRLESVMADHYRHCGYEVDHCGTGASGSKFDGGIDLRLRRSDEYVLVQCKHWNAYKVTHNDVHQLLGIVVNEGATGGILVNSGEFTKAAIEAATRLGKIKLIDGDELRQMIGPLPDEPQQAGPIRAHGVSSNATTFAANAAERLVAAAEYRVRHGSVRRTVNDAAVSTLTAGLIKLAFAGIVVLVFIVWVNNAFDSLGKSLVAKPPTPRGAVAAPATPATTAPAPQEPAAQHASAYANAEPTRANAGQNRTRAEQREWDRRQAESMKIIEASTPEMQRRPVPESAY